MLRAARTRSALTPSSPTIAALWADPVMGSRGCRFRDFPVNCNAFSLHNIAPWVPRRFGHSWPVTNGDEHVGDLLLGIEDAATSTPWAKRPISRRLRSGARTAGLQPGHGCSVFACGIPYLPRYGRARRGVRRH